MAPLLSFWKPAKLFSNFLVLIHSVCQILKVRIAKRGVVQRSQSLLASVFLAHYFRNIRSVQEYFLCLSIVGCVSTWVNLQICAAVPECHIYWHLQKLTVLYLPPVPSYFNENAGVFFQIYNFIFSHFRGTQYHFLGALLEIDQEVSSFFFAVSLPSKRQK